jgi:hypothetical protein
MMTLRAAFDKTEPLGVGLKQIGLQRDGVAKAALEQACGMKCRREKAAFAIQACV